MTSQEVFLELRRHGFVPAPKLGTLGIWSLAPPRGILTDPEKAKVEVVLLGPDRFTIGPPGMPAVGYYLINSAALASDLSRHGGHAPSDEKLRPDFFAIPEKAKAKAKSKAR